MKFPTLFTSLYDSFYCSYSDDMNIINLSANASVTCDATFSSKPKALRAL